MLPDESILSPSGNDRRTLRARDFTAKEHLRFCMLTAGWYEVFIGGRILNLNELRLYTSISLYYNRTKERSYPGGTELENYFQADGSEERRSLSGLAKLGLAERWKQRMNSRTTWRFFRLPYVDSKGRHLGTRQQPTACELLAAVTPPAGYEWLQNAELLTPLVTPEQVEQEIERRLCRWTDA